MKRKKKKPLWLKAALLVGVLLILLMGYQLFRQLDEYRAGTETYEEILAVAGGDSREGGFSPEADAGAEPEYIPPVDFIKLKEINPDIVGWIVCEGTKINYPVVQGEDNSYYLNHLFDGTVNSSGCIFMDQDNDPKLGDDNTNLYGHHMRNGSMFAVLEEYKTQAFYEEHPVMMYYTAEHAYEIKLFAGNIFSGTNASLPIKFSDKQERQRQIEKWKSDSLFESDVMPEAEDHLITLCTCTYNYANARYAVFGILEEVM